MKVLKVDTPEKTIFRFISLLQFFFQTAELKIYSENLTQGITQ